MKNYETTDFYLTSFLLSEGLNLSGHTRNKGRVTFQFTKTAEIENLIDQYYQLTAKVSPLKYSAAIKMLKRLLYDHIPVSMENEECLTKVKEPTV